MKKNQFRFVKVLACLGFMFFYCENVLLAQTPRRKPVVKRATPVGGDKQKVENTTGVNEQTTQSGTAEIANPKLQPDAEVAVFETDYGAIVVELYPKLAPQMVERFKRLIREGFYNKTTFHRASPSLGIIQGGDPNSKDADPSNDGYGKSPYPNVPAENSDVPYTRGIVGAARANDPNSANCQFFIMLKRQPIFDKKYTIFGRVIEGLSNAYVISISPNNGASERPEDPVVVKRVRLQPRKKFIAGN
jgi:cyclophilin family peptidyl-prolyl cis-trans isomerase